jgi:hypothetical protein
VTPEEIQTLFTKLDRIIELLELQTFVPEGAAPVCGHENAIDIGTMGMHPREKMYCPKCDTTFDRSKVGDI